MKDPWSHWLISARRQRSDPSLRKVGGQPLGLTFLAPSRAWKGGKPVKPLRGGCGWANADDERKRSGSKAQAEESLCFGTGRVGMSVMAVKSRLRTGKLAPTTGAYKNAVGAQHGKAVRWGPLRLRTLGRVGVLPENVPLSSRGRVGQSGSESLADAPFGGSGDLRKNDDGSRLKPHSVGARRSLCGRMGLRRTKPGWVGFRCGA